MPVHEGPAGAYGPQRPAGAYADPVSRGRQHPAHPDLWALLTGPELEGLEVVFDCGLHYVVGRGFADPYGRPVDREQAYAVLRVAWHLGPVYPRREGDTSQGRHPA